MAGAHINRRSVPDCCMSCANLDWDSIDEYSPSFAYCLRNQMFPTKKLECKAHKPAPKEPTHE